MKKQFLFVAFATMTNFSFAQSSLDLSVEKKIKELQKDNVSVIVNCCVECIDSELPPVLCDTCCIAMQTKYLFWIRNEKYFSQKFDDCKKYHAKELVKSKFLRTVVKQRDVIKHAEIKPVEHYVKNKKRVEDGIVMILEADHQHTTHFDFYIQGDIFSKSIEEFYLTTKKLDKKTKNQF